MVDNKVIPRLGLYGRGRGSFRGSFRGRGRYDRNSSDRDGGRRGARGGRNHTRGGRSNYRSRWEDRRNIQREASVQIGSDWVQLEEITSGSLSKMSLANVGTGENILTCGTLPFLDRTLDRVSAKNPRPLKVLKREYARVTTTDDPIIRRLAGSGEGNVFATSAILALIMMTPRAVQSWDLIVLRIGGKLFIDKRDGSLVDYITVNETSPDPPKDEKNLQGDEVINSFQKLALEATAINENFSQAVTSKTEAVNYKEPNPFLDEISGEPARIAYRYRKWTLSNDITVVARCELDGAFRPNSSNSTPIPITIRALNEYFDPLSRVSTDWRGKLDTQRGAVLATEVKNNAPKLARWTAEAILADTEHIKFGFISRVVANRNERHTILGTQMYRPRDFASQIALNTKNMWGILKNIIDICMKSLQDGEKGVLLKDPNKPVVRLFRVPDDAFDSPDEDDDDKDGQPNVGGFM